MSWSGRKRAFGDRHPCGKLKRRKLPPPPVPPHRRGYGSNPLAETQHGRYLLDGAITASQHVAGSYYGRSRLRYRAVMGAPSDLRSRFEGYTGESDPERDAKVIAEFETARHALGCLVVDVEWVVVQDAVLADLTAYRQGLDVLRKVYRV
jgi:hypothetical protein